MNAEHCASIGIYSAFIRHLFGLSTGACKSFPYTREARGDLQTEEKIVVTLSRQLSWSRSLALHPLATHLPREHLDAIQLTNSEEGEQ